MKRLNRRQWWPPGWKNAGFCSWLTYSNKFISLCRALFPSLTDETLKKLAKIFSVSIDFILCETDDPTPIRDVDQDLHDEHDYNKELDAFLNDDEMSSMFYDYKNWTEEEKRNLLNILKGQEALRQMNKKK